MNLKSLITGDSPEKKLIFFLLKLFAIWLSWKGIFWVLGEENIPLDQRLFPAISAKWEAFNQSFKFFLIKICKSLLIGLGYEVNTHDQYIWISNSQGVGIGNYCLGIQLMYYYVMLMIVSPFHIYKRILGMISGIVITFLLNIIRISALCIVSLKAPQWMHNMHDHVFNIIVFGTLMLLYYRLNKQEV